MKPASIYIKALSGLDSNEDKNEEVDEEKDEEEEDEEDEEEELVVVQVKVMKTSATTLTGATVIGIRTMPGATLIATMKSAKTM